MVPAVNMNSTELNSLVDPSNSRSEARVYGKLYDVCVHVRGGQGGLIHITEWAW